MMNDLGLLLLGLLLGGLMAVLVSLSLPFRLRQRLIQQGRKALPWRKKGLSRREALQQTLQQMGTLLTGYSSLDELLQKILEMLEQVVDYDSCSLILFDEQRGVYLAASRGIDHLDRMRRGLAAHQEKFLPAHWEGERTIYIPDTRNSEDWFPLPEASYILSWIGAALLVKDHYIGLLNVDHSEVNAYSEEDIRIVRAFADQAAVAIENARLFEETRQSARRLQVLYDLNKKLAATLESPLIIDRALALSLQAVGGEKADYYRFYPAGDVIKLERSQGRTQSEIEKINYYLSFGENKSDVGWVREQGKSISISNVRENDLWIEMPLLDTEIRSLITVPVRIDHRVAGAISVLHSREGAFSRDQKELLEAMAQQVGLALNNARRYVEVAFLLNSLKAKQELQDKMLEHLPMGILLLDDHFRILSGNSPGHQHIEDLGEIGKEQTISRLGDKRIRELIRLARDPFPVEVKKGPPSKAVYEVLMRRVETIEGKYWILIITDVTREREIRKRMQVQERMATLGQFAAGIAHDFNNIISAILVYSDVIKKEQISEKNLTRIDAIREQAHRATNLISQILDFSRHSQMEQKPFDLVPFLQASQELLKRMLPENIQVDLQVAAGVKSLFLFGDPARIQQMILNLALNARDAMPDGGGLEILLSIFYLPAGEVAPFPTMKPGRWICLQVKDEGVGISPSDQSRIFDPFFTTKENRKGTGLGLSQVYGIVKQHAGYIDLTSEPGKGTTFRVYFPYHDQEVALAEKDEEKVHLNGESRVVLIVEDDESLRNALWNMLEEYNFQVILAGNGSKGSDIIQQIGERLSLVITDIVMPDMGGVEMYYQARKNFPRKQFLFITGHPSHIRDEKILSDEYACQLQKPFTMLEILELIKEMCFSQTVEEAD